MSIVIFPTIKFATIAKAFYNWFWKLFQELSKVKRNTWRKEEIIFMLLDIQTMYTKEVEGMGKKLRFYNEMIAERSIDSLEYSHQRFLIEYPFWRYSPTRIENLYRGHHKKAAQRMKFYRHVTNNNSNPNSDVNDLGKQNWSFYTFITSHHTCAGDFLKRLRWAADDDNKRWKYKRILGSHQRIAYHIVQHILYSASDWWQ